MRINKKKSVVVIQGACQQGLFDKLKQRKIKNVFLTEGRPTLKAARKNSEQLLKKGINPVLIADNMAGFLFYRNFVKEIWIGYQIKSREGALCEIGALILAVLGKKHKVPVKLYPARPLSEMFGRNEDITFFQGKRISPKGIKGYVPLVEWIPKKYITRIYP